MARKLFMCTLVILTLTGCSIPSYPTELMRAPSLTTELDQLRHAVNSFLPDGAQISIPRNSSTALAIEEVDIDGDGMKEAFATYKINGKNETSLGIIAMKQSNGVWMKSNDLEIKGIEFDFVRFEDLAKNGQLKLLVGSVISEFNDEKIVYMFNLEAANFYPFAEMSYDQFEIGDLDANKQDEVVILRNNHNELTADASIYRYDENELKLVDSIPLDGTINGFSAAIIGKASSTSNGLFIEVGVGAHSAYSILLVMDNGKLKDVFDTVNSLDSMLTFTAQSVFSIDINQDGIIEIPTLEELTPDVSYSEMAFRTVWNQWDGYKGLKPVYYTYNDYSAGYRFDIPTSWKSSLQVKRNEHREGETTFEYINKAGKKIGELAAIHCYNIDEWPQIEKEWNSQNLEYELLGNHNNRVYIGIIPTNQPLALSKEEYAQFLRMKIDLLYMKSHIVLLDL